MLSIAITMAIILLITELYIDNQPTDQILASLIKVARERYVYAYKNDIEKYQNAHDIFNYVIANLRFIDGEFDITDRYTFKQVLVDSISIHKYRGEVRRSEAMFIMDFMMEAYHEISPSNPIKVNLTYLKEHV